MKPNRVAIIGATWPAYEIYCPNFTGMQIALYNMEIDHKLFTCRPVLDVDALIEYQPDLIVYGLIDMIKHYENRMKIRRALPDAKIVMWYGDLRNGDTSQITANASEIDMMFVSNDAQREYYKQMWKVPDCLFLPLGAPIWDRAPQPHFARDFVFIGGLITGAGFLERARIMWKLKKQGLTVIDGPVHKPKLRAKIMKQMPTIYRSAKICLDWSHFTDIQGYTSNRFWIIPASAGFALTKRWPGCEDFYPEGTRVYFDTVEELLELRDYYLEHEDEREKIRMKGYARAQLHTYEMRFDTMFGILYGTKDQN